jgi:hypothetical protein
LNPVSINPGRAAFATGIRPQALPRDAAWGERFFHVTEHDGHKISFAWPLKR